jgi:hypothetical protein
MTQVNAVNLSSDILAKLKHDFDTFRDSSPHKRVTYPEALKLRAVSALNEYSFETVQEACGVSFSALLVWKNTLSKKVVPPVRRLLVIENDATQILTSNKESNNVQATLKCPNGLKILVQQSYVPELLRLCGGLK